MIYTFLAINPGSTSTKLAIYENNQEKFTKTIRHSAEEIAQYDTMDTQFAYRLGKVEEFLKEVNQPLASFSAIVGRGGILKPMPSGTYYVNDTMLEDVTTNKFGYHASNFGAMLASHLAKYADCPAFIVDPIVVDELLPISRITGRPEINKISIFHALNQKAVAKRFAQSIHRPYEELNLIVTHLGGGISVGCHHHGQVIDVTNTLNGEGPFTPERAGTVQAMQFAELIIDNKLTKQKVAKMLAGEGGLLAHLGTTDAREVEQRIANGDKHAEQVYQAMLYSIAKYIAAYSVAVCGNVDYILITGSIAYSNYVISHLKDYVSFIAPIVVIPGESELQALAEGALRVLTGAEQAKEYI